MISFFRRAKRGITRFQPCLELLDDRSLLSVIFPVNNGFEVPNLGTGHGALGYGTPIAGPQLPPAAVTGWTFVGASGITANGAFDQSGDSNGNSDGTTSDAGQAAFIQYAPQSFPNLTLSSISQALVFQAGTASVAFDIQRRDVFGNNPINVKIDSQDLGTYLAANLSGFNTITTPTVPISAGTHTLYFIGTNPSGSGSSNGDVTQFIDNVSVTNTPDNIPTVTTLTISPAPTLLGQPFSLVAQVSDPNPVTGGSVDFYDGATLVGSASVSNGTATLALNYLSTGSGHSFTAIFSGAGNDLPSTSSAIALADPTQAPTFFALQGSALDQALLAASRNQEVDTGNAAALTLYDQNGNAVLTLNGENINYVGGGAAIKGVIYTTSNIDNGDKLTSSTYLFSLTLYDASLNPVTLDAFNAVSS